MGSLVGPPKRQTNKNNHGCDLPSHIHRDIFWGLTEFRPRLNSHASHSCDIKQFQSLYTKIGGD